MRQGYLLTPPFVDAHFHMDATLSYGLPRVNQSGTLLEGIALWGELKPQLTQEAIVERALPIATGRWPRGCSRSARTSTCATRGCSRSRRCCTCKREGEAVPRPAARRVSAGRRAAQRRRARAPEDGARDGRGRRRRHSALRAHDARRHRERAHAVRDRRGRRDGSSTCIATRPTTRIRGTSRRSRMQSLRLGLQGRVTGSHLTSMHSMDNYYVSKLIPLMHEAGVSAVANPLINITIQGRHDTYPKRRGMTRVPELMAAGVTVAFGHDCVMDPWYCARQRRHARGGVDGPARRADDEPGGHARVLRRRHRQRRARSCTSTATASRPATAPTSCCCRRAIRSRRFGCARRGSTCFARAR